jgi:hypothetical protein
MSRATELRRNRSKILIKLLFERRLFTPRDIGAHDENERALCFRRRGLEKYPHNQQAADEFSLVGEAKIFFRVLHMAQHSCSLSLSFSVLPGWKQQQESFMSFEIFTTFTSDTQNVFEACMVNVGADKLSVYLPPPPWKNDDRHK